jgi:hypothetical protein
VLSVIRYVAVGCIRSHRWFPPALAYGLALAVTYAPGGPSLPTLTTGAAVLLPIAAWLTVSTINFEDASQAAVTAAAVGGIVRARLGTLLAALLGSYALVAVSLVAAYLSNDADFGLRVIAVGLLMHLLTAAAGVGVGSLCAPPVIRKAGWTVVLLLLATAGFLLTPDTPPMRALLDLIDSDHPAHLAVGLVVIAIETVAGAVACTAGGLALARRVS